MIKFETTILRFNSNGEKTGWTYINIPAEIAGKLQPGNRKGFRVKGKLDDYAFKQVSLLPMGEGDFIMTLNKEMRNGLGKSKGHKVIVKIEVDKTPVPLAADLVECLEDEPKAKAAFEKLSSGEKNYFSNWIKSAKTEPTKAKRIAQTLNGMLRGQKFGEMLRALKAEKENGLR